MYRFSSSFDDARDEPMPRQMKFEQNKNAMDEEKKRLMVRSYGLWSLFNFASLRTNSESDSGNYVTSQKKVMKMKCYALKL